jgi:uncharacterized membrane protein YhhN
MQRSLWILTGLALLAGILTLRAEYFGPAYQLYLFKPLTMVLIIIIAFRQKRTSKWYHTALLCGLGFSLAGDIFLMWPDKLFLPGLVAFLIGHLFYIGAFSKGIAFKPFKLSALFFIAYGCAMYIILLPGLGDMKIPVLIYLIVILFMAWQALQRFNSFQDKGSELAYIGAALFVVSDSILAISRFRDPFLLSRLLILVTYFTAQWFIARSGPVEQ